MPSQTRKTGKSYKNKTQKSKVRIPISKGGELTKYGYHDITKMSEKSRRAALMRFIESVGSDIDKQIVKARMIVRKLNALSILQKNTNPELSRRVRRDQQFVSRMLSDLKAKQE